MKFQYKNLNKNSQRILTFCVFLLIFTNGFAKEDYSLKEKVYELPIAEVSLDPPITAQTVSPATQSFWVVVVMEGCLL